MSVPEAVLQVIQQDEQERVQKQRQGKSSKQAVLYLHVLNTDYRCRDCVLFIAPSQRCAIHGQADVIRANGYCGFFAKGRPVASGMRPGGNVTKAQSGYGEDPNGTTCRRCVFFSKKQHDCLKVDKDTEGDDPGEINPAACCNEQTPKHPLAKRYAQAQALAAWRRWADSGERFDKDGARNRNGLWARTILQLSTDRVSHEERRKVDAAVAQAYGQVEDVDPHKITTGQRRLRPDGVLRYLENVATPPTRGPRGLPGTLPTVMRYQGLLSAVDGNHRVGAAVLLGLKAIRVVVVDMDAAERDHFDRVNTIMKPPSLTSLRKRAPHPVHVIADKYVPVVQRAVATAFEHGRVALHGTNWKPAVRTIAKELRRALPPLLERICVESGTQAYAKLRTRPRQVRKDAGFDAGHPRLRDWIERHTAESVKGVSQTTKDEIVALLDEAFVDETLDQRDLMAEIRDLLGDKDRAELIARTETMRAANAGQREAWRQGVEDGYVEPTERRVWIVTDDDALCEDCEPLDGAVAPLDGEYEGDGEDGPPLHPDCRCVEGLE